MIELLYCSLDKKDLKVITIIMARRGTKTVSGKRSLPQKHLAFIAVVAVASVFFVHRNSQTNGQPSVLGVATSFYTSATIAWNSVAGAAGYNIYYKTDKDKDYTFSVRGLPSTSTSYKIDYLVKNKKYEYEVKAYYRNPQREFWTSTRKPIISYSK